MVKAWSFLGLKYLLASSNYLFIQKRKGAVLVAHEESQNLIMFGGM